MADPPSSPSAAPTTQKHFAGSGFEPVYLDILRELRDRPEFTPTTRGIGCREITALSFELSDPRDRIVWNAARGANYDFAMKFFLWTLNAETDVSLLAGANPRALDFASAPAPGAAPTQASRFSTAYGPRIRKQLPAIFDELRRDPGSRRCVIHILDAGDLDMLGTDAKEEYPCAETLSLLIRDGKLIMHANMRSNNMALTVCYDVFLFTMLQEYMLRELARDMPGLALGAYQHHAMSAHYFDNEAPLVERILACDEVGLLHKKPAG